MQSRHRKRQTESVHTNTSSADVSHVDYAQLYSNRRGRWKKHKSTMKWFYQNDKKFCKLISNTKAQFKKKKKETQNQDPSLSTNVSKAYGLVRTGAHISTLEPNTPWHTNVTHRQRSRACTSMLLHSSPERYLALPTNTIDVLICRIRRTETQQFATRIFQQPLKGLTRCSFWRLEH